MGADPRRAPRAWHRAAATEPVRRLQRHAVERTRGRHARGARVRLLPAEQARGMAGLPPPGDGVRARQVPLGPLAGWPAPSAEPRLPILRPRIRKDGLPLTSSGRGTHEQEADPRIGGGSRLAAVALA